MRVSKEEKAASHERIVEVAGGMFKRDGVDATGVAAVMKAAGLTHGGFYRHFPSKADLVNAALQKSSDIVAERLEHLIAQKGAKAALPEYVESYLSREHMANPDKGCPFAALGAETARGSAQLQTVMARGRARIISLLAQGFNGNQTEQRQKASALLATLVGAIILARSAPSASEKNEILSDTRAAVLAGL